MVGSLPRLGIPRGRPRLLARTREPQSRALPRVLPPIGRAGLLGKLPCLGHVAPAVSPLHAPATPRNLPPGLPGGSPLHPAHRVRGNRSPLVRRSPGARGGGAVG